MKNALPDSAGKRYTKLPVVIEALQYTGGNGAEIGLFVGEADRNADNQFLIHTLEGTMAANPGDWIIKGVNGEFYPCKPDIFLKTYAPDDGSGILVIPPGLMNNIRSAGYAVTGIQSKKTDVAMDHSTDLAKPETVVVHVEHTVEITAERSTRG